MDDAARRSEDPRQPDAPAPEQRLPDVDEGQISALLRLTPDERLARFTRQSRSMNAMLRGARRIT